MVLVLTQSIFFYFTGKCFYATQFIACMFITRTLFLIYNKNNIIYNKVFLITDTLNKYYLCRCQEASNHLLLLLNMLVYATGSFHLNTSMSSTILANLL